MPGQATRLGWGSVYNDISRYTDGCLDKLLGWGEGQCIMIAGVAVGGAVLHILGTNANII